MLTKNQIKFISQLKQKKHRDLSRQFFVEGIKGVEELLQSSLVLVQVYSTEPLKQTIDPEKFTLITEAELKKISALTTPNTCLAVFEKPAATALSSTGLQVVLDDVRDPGNLGTIIRLCDWFGVSELICSEETVDVYNPKVVQATMGSITRVKVHYTDLNIFLQNTSQPVFGTFMEGDTIYNKAFPKNGILVMGNEANGISSGVEQLVQHRITIPRFGALQQAESLNVATATAITLSEFKRATL